MPHIPDTVPTSGKQHSCIVGNEKQFFPAPQVFAPSFRLYPADITYSSVFSAVVSSGSVTASSSSAVAPGLLSCLLNTSLPFSALT